MKLISFGTEVGNVPPAGYVPPSPYPNDNPLTGRSLGQRVDDKSYDIPFPFTGTSTTSIQLLLQKVRLDLTAFAREVGDAMKIPALTAGELANAKDFYAFVANWLSIEPSKYWTPNAERAQNFLGEINNWRISVAEKIKAAKKAREAKAAGQPPPAITPISISIPPPVIRPSILGPVLAAIAGAAATSVVAIALRGKKKLDVTHRLGKPEEDK